MWRRWLWSEPSQLARPASCEQPRVLPIPLLSGRRRLVSSRRYGATIGTATDRDGVMGGAVFPGFGDAASCPLKKIKCPPVVVSIPPSFRLVLRHNPPA